MAQRKGPKFKQGEDELVHYELELDPAPSLPGITTVWDETDEPRVDVTTTIVLGSSVVQNGLLITAGIANVVEDHTYRVECQYTDGNGNLLEPWFTIVGER